MIGFSHRFSQRPTGPSRGHAPARFAFFAITALLAATGASAAGVDRVSASIDGHAWVATRDFFTATQIGGKPVLSLTAFLDATPVSHFTFNVFVPGIDHPNGVYALGQGSAVNATHGSYVANGAADANPLEDSYRFVDGSVTITAYDAATKSVSGTFSGTVRNHSGKTLAVSQGSFAGVGMSP